MVEELLTLAGRGDFLLAYISRYSATEYFVGDDSPCMW